LFCVLSLAYLDLDPQAGAVSCICRRIFIRRKSAEKVWLAEYAITRYDAVSDGIGMKFVLHKTTTITL